MEKIQLVYEQLRRIEGAYYPFFQKTNTRITDYVRIMPNSTNNWLNVMVRNEPELLPEIKSRIEKAFEVIK